MWKSIEIKIKAGYTFNGASIPRAVWSLVGSPFQPEYIGPSAVHDYIYEHHKDSKGMPLTRKQADKVFRACLKMNGVNTLLAWTLYRGVRAGGWVGWKKKQG